MKPVFAPEAAVAAQRAAMRKHALAARQALDPALRHARTQQLVGHLDALVRELAPATLGFCWPYRAEPDLRDWVEGWLRAAPGRVAALPVVLERHAAMSFRPWVPGEEMPLDRHGIPHPARGENFMPEIVLVPLNAFDDAGYRLGYGGGYFDRTLERSPTLAVGVGFELGRVASALPQPHDRPMDWIVTERGASRPVR